MKTHPNEVLVYYDRESSVGKKVLALAKSVSPHVKEIEYKKNNITPSLMRVLLKTLDLRPKDLLNRAHPFYQEHIKGRDFDSHGWLKILVHNPELIRSPIVIRGKEAVLCDNPTDIYKLSNLTAV